MLVKNLLIVVNDITASVWFYQKLFILEVEYDFGENVSFAGGPALQSLRLFAQMTGVAEVLPGIRYVHVVVEHPWGQRFVHI